MLKRTRSSPFSPFLQCWQICTSCEAGNPGNLCKDYLLLPVSRHSCVLFSLSLCRDSPHSSVVRPQLPIFRDALCLQLSRSDPASLCTPDRTNSSLFSTGSLVHVVPFSNFSGTEWHSTDLKCYAPCNWISLSFLLLKLPLSIPVFPGKFPPRWHHIRTSSSVAMATLGVHSWSLLAR